STSSPTLVKQFPSSPLTEFPRMFSTPSSKPRSFPPSFPPSPPPSPPPPHIIPLATSANPSNPSHPASPVSSLLPLPSSPVPSPTPHHPDPKPQPLTPPGPANPPVPPAQVPLASVLPSISFSSPIRGTGGEYLGRHSLACFTGLGVSPLVFLVHSANPPLQEGGLLAVLQQGALLIGEQRAGDAQRARERPLGPVGQAGQKEAGWRGIDSCPSFPPSSKSAASSSVASVSPATSAAAAAPSRKAGDMETRDDCEDDSGEDSGGSSPSERGQVEVRWSLLEAPACWAAAAAAAEIPGEDDGHR
ncbi:unnamed protein product, partial [Closterium sp. NIES-53]